MYWSWNVVNGGGGDLSVIPLLVLVHSLNQILPKPARVRMAFVAQGGMFVLAYICMISSLNYVCSFANNIKL